MISSGKDVKEQRMLNLNVLLDYKSSQQASSASGSSSSSTFQMLSNTPSRSAFLQSLQRSRERNSAAAPSASSSGDAQTPSRPKSSSTFTPRRLSLSPLPAAAELKPAANTPSMQSKLASHAYTLSRSSDEEMKGSRDSLLYAQESEFEALKREIEQDKRRESFYSTGRESLGGLTRSFDKNSSERSSAERLERSSSQRNSPFERTQTDNHSASLAASTPNRPAQAPTFSFSSALPANTPVQPLPSEPSFSVLESSRRAPLPSEVDSSDDRYRPSRRYQAINVLPEDSDTKLKQLIQAEVSASLSSLRNDLQNLQVELIKQSLAQQATMRSLFETYLPMTGQLMDALTTAREENERLKLLLSRK